MPCTKKLSPEQVAAVWMLAAVSRGRDVQEKAVAAAGDAVSYAYVESGFCVDAVSSASCIGLWQLCPPPDDGAQPLANAQGAMSKWIDGGYGFSKHWDAFEAGGTGAKRLGYLPRAKIAAARVKAQTDGGMNGDKLSKILEKGGVKSSGDVKASDLLGGNDPVVKAAGDAVDNVGEAITTVFKPIADFFKIITSADTWIRVGKVLLGALLLLLAVEFLTGGGLTKAGRAANRAANKSNTNSEEE